MLKYFSVTNKKYLLTVQCSGMKKRDFFILFRALRLLMRHWRPEYNTIILQYLVCIKSFHLSWKILDKILRKIEVTCLYLVGLSTYQVEQMFMFIKC